MSLDLFILIKDTYRSNLQTNNPTSQALAVDYTNSLSEIMKSINSHFSYQETYTITYLFALFIYKLEEGLEFDELSCDYLLFIAGNPWYLHRDLDIFQIAFDNIIGQKVMNSNDIQEIIKWSKSASFFNNYCISYNKYFDFNCLINASNKLIVMILELTENGKDAKIIEYREFLVGQVFEAYSNGIDVSLLRNILIFPIFDYINNTYQEIIPDPDKELLTKLKKICENDEFNKKYIDDIFYKFKYFGTNDNPSSSYKNLYPKYFDINKDFLNIDRIVPKYADTKPNYSIAIYSGKYYDQDIIAKQYSNFSSDIIKEIEQEREIYEKLSKLSDPENCFIKYYGAVLEERLIILIIKAYPQTLGAKIGLMRTTGSYISEEMFMKFAYKLTNSYAQMAQLKIVQRDIKPLNIVIDDNFDTRIIDFGHSLSRNENLPTLSTDVFKVAGTLNYLAPELDEIIKSNIDKRGLYNPEKADVYSLGLVFFEILSLWDLTDMAFDKNYALWYLDNNLSYLSGNIKYFLRPMLAYDPKNRPTFKQVLSMIRCDLGTIYQGKT